MLNNMEIIDDTSNIDKYSGVWKLMYVAADQDVPYVSCCIISIRSQYDSIIELHLVCFVYNDEKF